MIRLSAELVVDCANDLGEGPTWDAVSSSLLWTDVHARAIHRYWPDSGKSSVIRTALPIGSLVMREQGGAVAAGRNGFHFLDLTSGDMQPIGDPEDHLPHTMFNDGKCDPLGRFLAGTSSQRNEPEGAFYALDPDLHIRKYFDGVYCSNGIAWSADFRTIYYIDSLAYEVIAFDYDLPSGSISGGRRSVIRFEDRSVLPDGMTWDAEGMLWIAEWGGWRVCRWNPATGERLAIVDVPSRNVTSCVFAGEESDALYITTARSGATGEDLAAQPHSGGLFRVSTGVNGGPSYRFRG